MLPASNDLGRGWLSQNKGLPTTSGQLCEGLLVTVVALVLRYYDEIDLGKLVQGSNA